MNVITILKRLRSKVAPHRIHMILIFVIVYVMLILLKNVPVKYEASLSYLLYCGLILSLIMIELSSYFKRTLFRVMSYITRLSTFVKNESYLELFLSLCFALSVYSTDIFHRGYVLSLDMIWTPQMNATFELSGMNNSYVVWLLIETLTDIVGGELSQKLMLLSLLSLLVYIPYKYILISNEKLPRILGAIIYSTNPFVYSRLIAGQWLLLYGYALLPLLTYYLHKTYKNPTKLNIAITWLLVIALSIFSIHLTYILSLLLITYFMVFSAYTRSNLKLIKNKTKRIFISWPAVTTLLFTATWLVPYLWNGVKGVYVFNTLHFEAFAASSLGQMPILYNLIILGGFWGEGASFANYFDWPQDSTYFVSASVSVICIIIYGLINMYNISRTRIFSLLVVASIIMLTILSSGLSETIFYKVNLILYKYIPLYSGLRDSTKYLAFLSLLYSYIFVYGTDTLIKSKPKLITKIMLVLITLTYSYPMIGTISEQMPTSQYPKGWYIAKKTLEDRNMGGNTLVLPWHGYLSLEFIENRILANPSREFFVNEKIISGKSVEVGLVYDQSLDDNYKKIDAYLRSDNLTKESMIDFLSVNNIDKIIIYKNSMVSRSEKGLIRWFEFNTAEEDNTDRGVAIEELLGDRLITIYSDKDIIVKTVDNF